MLPLCRPFVFAFLMFPVGCAVPALAAEQVETRQMMAEICRAATEDGRVVCADIGALDQTLVYNRFGSFNPFGMIFALDRDLAVLRSDSDAKAEPTVEPKTASDCAALTGAEHGHPGIALEAGNVRLKDCKRPRPLVLRANVGDVLIVRVSNWLFDPDAPDFSKNFCKAASTQDSNAEVVRPTVSRGDSSELRHHEVSCLASDAVEEGEPAQVFPAPSDWPRTRQINFVAQGLTPLPIDGEIHPGCIGTGSVAPDESFLCKYKLHQEGTYFFASQAAPAGGEGNGGSIVHGLFGALMVERAGTRTYRSQTSTAAFDAVWPRAENGVRHARSEILDYERTLADHSDTTDADLEHRAPLLNMAMVLDEPAPDMPPDQREFADASRLEIVHSDLNAIIYCDPTITGNDCRADQPGTPALSREPGFNAFREFSVFFHDELKTFYTRNYEELEHFGQLAGVKDGFAINYGASGMGSLLLANRKGLGPASECAECMYEEFFLASWANGDPALLEWYADDPSNVHHSYLNDPVVFRNFHAGPKETHVFHLHAHQWFAGNDPSRGAYLDSQTVAPQQSFTYNIYHGGLRGLDGADQGWWDTQGSGNRNRTIGDSIFHCHLYPHFAQGMWALWRVHDVLEDGTRKLPDGQPNAELSTRFPTADERGHSRPGSVDRLTGVWTGPETGDPDESNGTPIPALIPLPGEPLPLLPTYAADSDVDDTGAAPVLKAEAKTPMPGYPFYIAGQPGHRPPQAPLDIARDLGEHAEDTITDASSAPGIVAEIDERINGEAWLDGGIGRHVVSDGSQRELGFALPAHAADLLKPTAFDALSEDERAALTYQIVAKAFALGDLSAHLTEARIETLPNDGTRLERAAMGFHFNGQLYRADGLNAALRLTDAAGTDLADAPVNGLYPTGDAPLPDGSLPLNPRNAFPVNGNAPKPGAPFADPCGATAPETRAAIMPGIDPLMRTAEVDADYFHDPLLLGYRRYEVSAVQLDMIVNRAGWHDPQARINVRTAESERFKEAAALEGAKPISPTISDTEEPFFFRALSGECIEFRHTNELPKDLELDDFQVKTPTDTVGQHIHLVKFDVTASDGSGNGWNYEDGTFAADELATRRCASAGNVTQREDAEGIDLNPGECTGVEPAQHDIWRLSRTENRDRFQTTVQRWFADPILTMNGDPDDPQLRDRTLRTVFSHDHFGPSSIQQHGFYSALVIEPGVGVPPGPLGPPDSTGGVGGEMQLASICTQNDSECVGPVPDANRLTSVAWAGKVWDGTKRRVRMQAGTPTHPDYREFALSIADFALLYDPRDRTSVAALQGSPEPKAKGVAEPGELVFADTFGMGQIYCEAKWRLNPEMLNQKCGVAATLEFAADFDPVGGLASDSWYLPGELAPAWIAGGTSGDEAHRARFFGDIFDETASDEVGDLFEHLVSYRQRAAGFLTPPEDDTLASLAKPVAPPIRPESISVDHHDPYLVNYRGAPIPLRIGDKEALTAPSDDCRLRAMGVPGEHALDAAGIPLTDPSDVAQALANGDFAQCSVDMQLTGAAGDMGEALRSALHGDPETPILEAYQDERLVIRLIQGAQEVQHTFNIASLAFHRNIDQAFPAGKQPLGLSEERRANLTLRDRCLGNAAPLGSPVPAALDGRPDDYRTWRDSAEDHAAHPEFWRDYERVIAECDNLEGFTFAQEVGISEHFEMSGSLRADVPVSVEAAALPVAQAPSGDVPDRSSDFLYNFGSVDALWNGAWGLVRIYGDPDAPDPVTVAGFNPDAGAEGALSAEGTPIRNRLGEAGSRAEAVGGQAIPVGTGGLACPYPGEYEPPQRIVDAVLAAVETRTVWPSQRGTDYGGGRYDPDGLMLALLSADDLGIDGGVAATDGWDALTRADVIDAVAINYRHGPRPMTLRVRAGDCIRLRYVNALEDNDEGLRDRLGDATMPPIVPLNTDPFPHAPEHGGSVGLLQPREADLRPGGVRPSAQVALSVGLPGMDLIRDLPLAYGYGTAGLPAAQGDGVTVSRPFLFYAGRMRLDLPEEVSFLDLVNAITTRTAQELAALSPAWLSDGTDTFPPAGETGFLVPDKLQPAEGEDAIFSILGVNYRFILSPEAASDPLSQRLVDAEPLIDASEDGLDALVSAVCEGAGCLDTDTVRTQLLEIARRAAMEELDAKVHWIPYAFGAVPIRSTSDVVSHVQHGLFGAIDVVPRGWAQVGTIGQELDCEVVERYEICAARHAEGADPVPGAGATMLFDAEGPDGTIERTREFVLYYQDGLNLWDDASRIDWFWEDDAATPAVEPDGTPVKMVPDCIVCDDSYDRGENGVNYRSPSFTQALSEPTMRVEESDDLNAFVFPPDYLAAHPNALRLKACEGEQIVIRVIHPGGRARQRAFVMNGYNYDDLFPGFGFPHSVLLAPGKGMTAWLRPKAVPGIAVWHDGPTHIRTGGVWGLLDVAEAKQCKD